jgi:hypothetical protein
MYQYQPLTKQTHWLSFQRLLCLLFVTGFTQATVSTTWQPEVVYSSQPNQEIQGQPIQANETPEGLSAADWGDIQQKIHMGKYRAYPNPSGGYNSSNPAHGWQIDYHVDGTTRLSPRNSEAPAYQIGMKLTAIGYGKLQKLNQPQQIKVDDATVTYQWNANLKEWWINTPSQLEQWFSLEQRPTGNRQQR